MRRFFGRGCEMIRGVKPLAKSHTFSVSPVSLLASGLGVG